MSTTRKAWINGIYLIATLAINALGAFGFINGLSQKEISDRYSTLITPGPATFSIWSVIYSLLIISIIAMIIKKDDAYYQKAAAQITSLFRISCLLNMAWIIAFSYLQIELSVLFIFGFVITLSLICLKLLQLQQGKRWLLPLTFGIYTGWLFIATVVNIAAALVKLNWNGFGIAENTWAVITLAVAVVLVILVLSKIKNAAFTLPIAWAYFGIYLSLKSQSMFAGQSALQITALAGSIVLLAAFMFQLYKNHFSLLKN